MSMKANNPDILLNNFVSNLPKERGLKQFDEE